MGVAVGLAVGMGVGAGVGGGIVHSSSPGGDVQPDSQMQVYAATPAVLRAVLMHAPRPQRAYTALAFKELGQSLCV